MRRLGVLALAACAFGASAAPTHVAAAAAESVGATPRFTHVWVFVFENTNYDTVTAGSMPYFTNKAKLGVTLTQMYGVGHASLTNYIAMTSGQAPNPKTQADCFNYDCIYEKGNDANIADQLEGAHLTWRAYMDGMAKPCEHGSEGSGEPYTTGYATRHNPFMYYRSIVGNSQRCQTHVRPFADLASDRAAGNVANYNFISPDTCNDAHDDSKEHCKLADADRWLQPQLDPILASKEYLAGGAVFLTFDEAEISDASNCCGGTAPGGGHIATVVLSPQLAAPGTSDATHFSHYSLLRTVEDNFGLTPLLHAGDTSTKSMLTLFKVPTSGNTATTGSIVGASTMSQAPSATTGSTSKSKSKSKSTTLWVLGGLLVGIAGATVFSAKRRASKASEK